MQLEKLSIINYKNIQAATLNLSAKLNCFIGHNGEGKTNLLDAVYYLSFCKSAFNPKDSEVMRHDADYFVLEGDYCTDAGGLFLYSSFSHKEHSFTFISLTFKQ